MVLVEQADIDRLNQTIGNYKVLEILGRGGMGTVYRGEHVYIGKKVAIKVLHPRFAKYEDAVKRFLREARAASSINHPNIVDVTDFGPTPDGGVFFVMEYLEGTSLEDLIEKTGAIPLHRAINIANQLALALAAAHDKGIIHRDLKPDNIMLIRKPGRRDLIKKVNDGKKGYVVEKEADYEFVKILDFGIAKVLTPEDMAPSQTLAGAVFGTPEYMSPEAARGEEVDHRADVYSLGVILFDMITGRPPFEAQAAAEVLAMQISKAPPSPREVAPHHEITDSIEALILRAMAKPPDQRFQHMDELRAELQECYGSIAFKRFAHVPGGGPAAEAELAQRKRGISEELDDWLHSEKSNLDIPAPKAAAKSAAAGKPAPAASPPSSTASLTPATPAKTSPSASQAGVLPASKAGLSASQAGILPSAKASLSASQAGTLPSAKAALSASQAGKVAGAAVSGVAAKPNISADAGSSTVRPGPLLPSKPPGQSLPKLEGTPTPVKTGPVGTKTPGPAVAPKAAKPTNSGIALADEDIEFVDDPTHPGG